LTLAHGEGSDAVWGRALGSTRLIWIYGAGSVHTLDIKGSKRSTTLRVPESGDCLGPGVE